MSYCDAPVHPGWRWRVDQFVLDEPDPADPLPYDPRMPAVWVFTEDVDAHGGQLPPAQAREIVLDNIQAYCPDQGRP